MIEQIKNENKVENIKIGFQKEIIAAITSEDIDRLISVLGEVDEKLTDYYMGSPYENQINRQKEELENFLRDYKEKMPCPSAEIYLSDGGTSRLIINFEQGEFRIFPSNVSRQFVKEKWEEIQ